jgi:hypothetical protein
MGTPAPDCEGIDVFRRRKSCGARIRLLPAAVGVFISIALCGPVEAKRNGAFAGTANVTRGSVLRLENRRGRIVIRSGTEAVVRVRAEVRDCTDQGDLPGRYTPAEIIAYLERKPPIEQNEKEVRIGFMLDADFHLGVEIDYEIVAPAWVDLEIDAKYGDLDVQMVGERIEVDKDSGSVRIREPRGKLRARINDGSLQVLGTPREEWSLRSTAGGVEVVVPAGLGFELDAKTAEGRLDADVPLGEHKPGRFEGAIHGGGPRIQLRSERGTLAIRQRQSFGP